MAGRPLSSEGTKVSENQFSLRVEHKYVNKLTEIKDARISLSNFLCNLVAEEGGFEPVSDNEYEKAEKSPYRKIMHQTGCPLEMIQTIRVYMTEANYKSVVCRAVFHHKTSPRCYLFDLIKKCCGDI